MRLLIFGCLFLIGHLSPFAQPVEVTTRTNSEFGYAYQLKRSLYPVNIPRKTGQDELVHRMPTSVGESSHLHKDHDWPSSKSEKTNAFVAQVGRNFEGNNMPFGTPSDNTLAISNDGLIVSMDNESIAYFKENGDTIVKYGLLYPEFYNDSTMDRTPFDPRIIYDRYENRFIAYNSYRSQDYLDSRILISFSKPLVGDTVEWTTYQIHCDSTFMETNEGMYWFDYPNIAVSKSQLIIAVTVANHDSVAGTNTVTTNALFQILKSDGYAALPMLTRKVWIDAENNDGRKDIVIVPAIDALQSESYDSTIYMVSNYDGNSTKFFWFKLAGMPTSPGVQLTSTLTATSFFYDEPSYASQMGGNGGDRITITGCDIQSCLYQNGELHFVFIRSEQGWAELVHAKIGIASNVFHADTWGGAGTDFNCLHPSIASFGSDTTESSFLIAFLRTGPSIFPEICVINHDSAWSPLERIVKLGYGIIDLRQDLTAPWDSMERWGDYTAIQRRYNDPYKRCWLVGAHAFGNTPNYFGEVNGVNAWIAEVGDSLVMSQGTPASAMKLRIYPNPIAEAQILTIELPVFDTGQCIVRNSLGQRLKEYPFRGKSFQIDLEGFGTGIYFVSIYTKRAAYGTEKIMVRN